MYCQAWSDLSRVYATSPSATYLASSVLLYIGKSDSSRKPVAPGRFPIHNSKPAVLRSGTNAWKRVALRMGHAEKSSSSVSSPASGAVRATRRVCQATHPMIASSEGRRAGLMSAAIAAEEPSRSQAARVGRRRQPSASRIVAGSAQADRLVSQKMAGIQSSGIETAQNAPARMAVRSSSRSRPMRIISHMVTRLNRICKAMMAISEAKVYVPKTKKTVAISVG